MADPIQALLDAAANPKLTPGPLGRTLYERLDGSCFSGFGWFDEDNCVREQFQKVAEELGIAAARNGLRAVFEEFLRYGRHKPDCQCAWAYNDEMKECTCGWYARRQQIEAYLRSLPCPYDTNGDGNCGRIACPYCGKVAK